MDVAVFRALKRMIEFQHEHGHYPHLGGSLRSTLARQLECTGYLTINWEMRQIASVTESALREVEEAPRHCAAVRGTRLSPQEVFLYIQEVERLHIRDLRRLAETLNIPGRLKLTKRELIEAFGDVKTLIAQGWRLDPTITFRQWQRSNSAAVNLREALATQSARKRK